MSKSEPDNIQSSKGNEEFGQNNLSEVGYMLCFFDIKPKKIKQESSHH